MTIEKLLNILAYCILVNVIILSLPSESVSITVEEAKEYVRTTYDVSDTTSPTILDTYPQDGEMNVPIEIYSWIQFSEPMDQ